MDRSTLAAYAFGVLLLAGGGWFVYETQVACDGCEHSEYANDLTLENRRSVPADVSVTVRENGTVVAGANETVPAGEQVVLTDLVPYGTYDLTVRRGTETFRNRWHARGCHFQTVVVTREGLDEATSVC